MVFSGTSACAEQTAHPSADTNSSRQKIYISSPLMAFLRAMKILVKAFTLFFAEVSTVLREVIQMRTKKVHFYWHECTKVFRNSPLTSTFFWYSVRAYMVAKGIYNGWLLRQSSSSVNFLHMFSMKYGEQMAYPVVLVSLQSTCLLH